jgi:hypothetical protein
MGYLNGGYQGGHTGIYVGPYATAPVIKVGELQFRFKPASPDMRPEVAMVAGSKTYEFYAIESHGDGLGNSKNVSNLSLSTTWVNIDGDTVMPAGSSRIDLYLTPTTNTDPYVYHVIYWAPIMGKVAISATLYDANRGMVLTDPAKQLVIHHHRVSANDMPIMNIFNGQKYLWDEWEPEITGAWLNVNAPSTAHGYNFRKGALGLCELYADAHGAIESWKFDVVFTRNLAGKITRFGY